MTPYYTVTKHTTCPACQGTGDTPHPLWQAFFAWEEAQPVLDIQAHIERDLAWWRQHGYYGHAPRPDAMTTCGRCHGTGEVREAVALDDALQDLPIMQAILHALEELGVLAYVPVAEE